MPADEFDHTVEQLYAGPPDQFIAHRDAAVKRARAAGDKELADEIKALRRPTVAAALLNQLHRRDGATGLGDLLELGQRLRAAQSKLDVQAMKSLSTERNTLISQLVSEIVKASSEPLSGTVQEQLSDTLVAAVADAEAGRAVGSGRLVSSLRYSGFGDVDLQNAVAIPLPPQSDETAIEEKPAESEKETGDAERRRQADAERELAEATAALDAAVRNEEAAQQSAQLAERALSAARSTAKKASARVEQATATRSAAEQAVSAAEEAAAGLTRK